MKRIDTKLKSIYFANLKTELFFSKSILWIEGMNESTKELSMNKNLKRKGS